MSRRRPKLERATFRSLESANRQIAIERATRSDLHRFYERKLIAEGARRLDLIDALGEALERFKDLGACEDDCQHTNPECMGARRVQAAIKKAEARS